MTITAFLTVELDGLLIDPAVTLASGSKPLATRLVLAERQTPKGAALCLAILLCALSASLATIVNTRSDAEGAQAITATAPANVNTGRLAFTKCRGQAAIEPAQHNLRSPQALLEEFCPT